ncbi:hypothetical protein Ssi02_06650 [Sinosporangium siamense]|uniref:ABC-type branched-chain amino acid transport system, substrate-binding protein n=1 Tax=Sinosporangium siamense TaxID=1367973 RepID=A0A919RDH5_9ACTN|nr:hypothetical protein Ssi02_06650 [Sinosporangium siamense]
MGTVAGEVPYAELNSSHNGRDTQIRDLVERAAGEDGDLGAGVSGSLLPAPRFPLTQIILWALRHRDEQAALWENGEEAPDGSQRALDSAYREPLRQWSRGRTPVRSLSGRFEYAVRFLSAPSIGAAAVTVVLTEWLDTGGLVNVWILIGAVTSAFALAGLLAGFWSSGTFRYGWFARQPYIPRGRGEWLAGYVRRVAETEKGDPEIVERLLVNALLEDLRLAYSRGRPWPGWGRSGYAVLLIEDAGHGTVGRRFLTTLHKVLADTGRMAPLLVVAAADEWPADLCGGDHPTAVRVNPAASDMLKVYAEWRTRSAKVAPCPYLVIDTGMWRGDAGAVDMGRRRVIGRLRPVGYWLIAGTTVLAPLGFGAWTVLRTCEPGLSLLGGQCVGMSNATKNYDPALIPILNLINRENDLIPPSAKVFKVIYLGPLTTPSESGDPGTRVLSTASELVGIHARQVEFNERGQWRMRVEFANAGEDYRLAVEAAEAVAERAAEDRSIAAVIGLGWSRKSVQKAIGVLRGAQMPALTTTATADSLAEVDGERSGYFYRMAPPNSQQALVAAHWLGQGLPAAPGEKLDPNPKVGILRQDDAEELYSADLADSFKRKYVGESVVHDFRDSATLKREIRRACDDGVDVLFYTGRGELLAAVRQGWNDFCADEVVVLAGDEADTALAEVERDPQGHRVDLRFLALSNPAPHKQGVLGRYEEHVKRVLEGAQTDLRNSVPKGQERRAGNLMLPLSPAMLAHDAALAVTTALDGLLTGWAEGMDVRAGVQEHLRGLKVTGATGEIEFSAKREQHDALHRTVWLYSIFPKKPLEFEMSCAPTGSDANCTSSG